MPFDEREQRVFDVLQGSLGAFHSALAATIERLRSEAEGAEEAAGGEGDGADLGRFAVGRIDVGRFEAVAARQRVAVAPQARPRLDEAFRVLTELAARKEQLFRVNVEPGASLHRAVGGALAEIGRAFGAARVADLGRTGRYRAEEHAGYLGAFPFARWGRTERRLAPPLVVRVDGVDAKADGLAEFLDGGAKFVLLLRGEAPPAPLARLVTPGVFVAQVGSEADLAPFAAYDGPGVAAVVPAGAARFVHDPGAGPTLAERLRLDHVPGSAPERSLGGWSVFQQTEPLRQLSALVQAPTPGRAAGTAAPEDPAGRLAAWLLAQADLDRPPA